MKTLVFRSLSYDGFGFTDDDYETADKADFTLSGGKLAHFEVGLHEGPVPVGWALNPS